MYFVRTVESVEEAQHSISIGKSIDKWELIGADVYDHFKSISYIQKPIYLQKMGYDMKLTAKGTPSLHSYYLMEKLLKIRPIWTVKEETVVKALNLKLHKNKGYIRYLDGLTALQSFYFIPVPEQCKIKLPGDILYRYLACYEGIKVGTVFDDISKRKWDLFKPSSLIWCHPSGYTYTR